VTQARRHPSLCKFGLEGIVSKRRESFYSSGRPPHWIKTKNPDAPYTVATMLTVTRFGFSCAEHVLASHISPPLAIGWTVAPWKVKSSGTCSP
jgi:hypothetical protein